MAHEHGGIRGDERADGGCGGVSCFSFLLLLMGTCSSSNFDFVVEQLNDLVLGECCVRFETVFLNKDSNKGRAAEYSTRSRYESSSTGSFLGLAEVLMRPKISLKKTTKKSRSKGLL